MTSDPERQRRLAAHLLEAEHKPRWLGDAPLADKIDIRLAYFVDRPSNPHELVLVDRHGVRTALDERLAPWLVPAILLGLGALLVIFVNDDGPVDRLVYGSLFAAVAGLLYIKQIRAERHLLVDGERRRFVVYRGRRPWLEIPFEDLDVIRVELMADPGYDDKFRALVAIGEATVLLTGWTDQDDATTAAREVAELTQTALEAEPQRKSPHDQA